MLEILPFFILLDRYIFLVISTMSAFNCSQFSSNTAYKITADLLTDSAHYLLAVIKLQWHSPLPSKAAESGWAHLAMMTLRSGGPGCDFLKGVPFLGL